MTLLQKIRFERPEEQINNIKFIQLNEFGFYNVTVNMAVNYFNQKTINKDVVLPYPLTSFEKLPNNKRFEWRLNN